MKNLLFIISLLLGWNTFSQIVNVPDEYFFSYLMLYNSPIIDTNGDEQLQVSEALAITSLYIDSSHGDSYDLDHIEDFTGLEAFENLESITIAYANAVTAIDLSTHVNLTQFDIYNNALLSCINLHNSNNVNVDDSNSHLENLPNLNSVCLDDAGYFPFIIVGGAVGSGTINYTSDCTELICTPTDFLVYIPDDNFKQAILDDSDFVDNGDYEIQVSEAVSTVALNSLGGKNIHDLTGLETFTQLFDLNLHNNFITSIHVDGLSNLMDLDISNNMIEEIDLSGISSLQFAYFNDNNFTTLDFSNQDLLGTLYVNNNPNLLYINLQNGANIDLGFDFSNLPNLEYVCVDDLSNTTFTDAILAQVGHDVIFLDTACDPSLLDVYIPDMNFKNILLGMYDSNSDGEIQEYEVNTEIELLIEAYEISDLTGIEAFTSLEHLNCMENALTSLDVSSNLSLTYLECQSNNLSSLIFGDSSAITDVDCSSNLLVDIDLSNAPNLGDFWCNDNLFASLDFGTNHNLLRPIVSDNPDLVDINLKNGNNLALMSTTGDFANLPNLETVCVDDLSYTNLTDFILSEVGHTVTFTDDCSLSITENLANQIRIYPNPVEDFLYIETDIEHCHIKIYNQIGKLLVCKNSVENQIDISILNSGVYFVKIYNDNGLLEYQRIVKQ